MRTRPEGLAKTNLVGSSRVGTAIVAELPTAPASQTNGCRLDRPTVSTRQSGQFSPELIAAVAADLERGWRILSANRWNDTLGKWVPRVPASDQGGKQAA